MPPPTRGLDPSIQSSSTLTSSGSQGQLLSTDTLMGTMLRTFEKDAGDDCDVTASGPGTHIYKENSREAIPEAGRDEYERVERHVVIDKEEPGAPLIAKHKRRRNMAFDLNRVTVLKAKMSRTNEETDPRSTGSTTRVDIDETQESNMSRQYTQEEFLQRANKCAQWNTAKRRNCYATRDKKSQKREDSSMEGESLCFISRAQTDANGGKYTQNLLVHRLGKTEDDHPTWDSTMKALFGDHVDWATQWSWNGKNRPLGRERRMCPITGLQARYLDPRTGVPYADQRAYDTLTTLLKHEHVWVDGTGKGGWYTN